MITVSDLSKWYGSTQVLRDCSFSVNKGEVVVICGRSGSGKSTLIRCLNALEPFQKGQANVCGVALDKCKLSELPPLRRRVGMVFQQFELFPHLTALENIALGQQIVLGRDKEAAHARAHVLDVMVELATEGMTMVVVTHEMAFARKVASRVMFMETGAIVEDKPGAEFFSSPATPQAKAFLDKILAH
ncbi:MAG: artP [Microvirga sp.]|nr:artP [Microvirga sp.]